jgi:hypothetical protein
LVFFIVHADPQVNGAPQTESEWLPLRQALGSQDHPMRPIVVALGMGNVSETTVRGLASTTPRGAALIADGTATPGDAVHAVLNGVFWWRTRSEPLDGELRFRTPPGMRMLT